MKFRYKNITVYTTPTCLIAVNKSTPTHHERWWIWRPQSLRWFLNNPLGIFTVHKHKFPKATSMWGPEYP